MGTKMIWPSLPARPVQYTVPSTEWQRTNVARASAPFISNTQIAAAEYSMTHRYPPHQHNPGSEYPFSSRPAVLVITVPVELPYHSLHVLPVPAMLQRPVVIIFGRKINSPRNVADDARPAIPALRHIPLCDMIAPV
jgi:hypothetical protein